MCFIVKWPNCRHAPTDVSICCHLILKCWTLLARRWQHMNTLLCNIFITGEIPTFIMTGHYFHTKSDAMSQQVKTRRARNSPVAYFNTNIFYFVMHESHTQMFWLFFFLLLFLIKLHRHCFVEVAELCRRGRATAVSVCDVSPFQMGKQKWSAVTGNRTESAVIRCEQMSQQNTGGDVWVHRWCSLLTDHECLDVKMFMLILGLSLWLAFGYDVHISSIYLKVWYGCCEVTNKAQMSPVSSVCGIMIRR